MLAIIFQQSGHACLMKHANIWGLNLSKDLGQNQCMETEPLKRPRPKPIYGD